MDMRIEWWYLWKLGHGVHNATRRQEAHRQMRILETIPIRAFNLVFTRK